MKALAGAREHSRGRPLFWPETNLRERSVVLPRELAEETAMTLRENPPGENLDARNPRLDDGVPINGDEFSGFDACCGETLGERLGTVVPLRKQWARFGFQAMPEVGHAHRLTVPRPPVNENIASLTVRQP